jgi:hypothetical protein
MRHGSKSSAVETRFAACMRHQRIGGGHILTRRLGDHCCRTRSDILLIPDILLLWRFEFRSDPGTFGLCGSVHRQASDLCRAVDKLQDPKPIPPPNSL